MERVFNGSHFGFLALSHFSAIFGSTLSSQALSIVQFIILLVNGQEIPSIVNGVTCEGNAGMDRATVRFSVKRDSAASHIFNRGVYLVAVNDNCWDCKQSYVLGQFTAGVSQCASLLTSYGWTFALQNATTGVTYASEGMWLGQNGIYNFTALLNGVSLSSASTLDIQEEQIPDNAYIALAVWLSVIAAVIVLSMLWPYIAPAWSSKTPLPEPNPLSNPLVFSARDNKTSSGYSSSKKRVAFNDVVGDSAVSTPHTPASVAGSESDGGIWVSRRSVDGGQASMLSTPLLEEGNFVGGEEKDTGTNEDTTSTPTSIGGSRTPLSSRDSPTDSSVTLASKGGAVEKKKPPRLQCLDAFRGMTILMMIFVNYGGGGYYFFDHAPWNGLTFADLLFPWFIWIMGTSMAISMKGVHYDQVLRATCEHKLTQIRPIAPGQPRPPAAPPSKDLWHKIVRRSVILFAIGLFLNASNDLKVYRIPGVLQYFAIANLVIAGTIVALREVTCTRLLTFERACENYGLLPGSTWLPPHRSSRHDATEDTPRKREGTTFLKVVGTHDGSAGRSSAVPYSDHNGIRERLEIPDYEEGRNTSTADAPVSNTDNKDVGMSMYRSCRPPILNSMDPRRSILWCYAYEYAVVAALWLIYVLICLFAKAPGCPRGYMGPGGIGNGGDYPGCTGGIHRYIDVKVFGEDHIYDEPTCSGIYNCVSYDPEGLLGSFTACTLTYLGVLTGRVLVHFQAHSDRLRLWLGMGTCLLFLAACLCGFSQNDGLIPVNKNLWSASFGLLNGGSGMVVLSLFYLIVDVKKWWDGAPFVYLGLNPILLYCGHETFQEYFPFSWYEADPSHQTMMAMNVIGTGLWVAIAFYCYKVKFFVKI